MHLSKIHEIKEILASPKNVVVMSHTNPDGDAVGSLLAVYGILNSMGNQVTAILPNRFPDFLSWMSGASDILIFNENKNIGIQKITQADLIFCLDFNSSKRVDKITPFLESAKATKILIDHHPNPEDFCDIIISKVEISSTAELIFELFSKLGYSEYIDKSVAEALYVGISTDTGSFSYSCNYSQTFAIVAELIKKDINCEQIHRYIYDTYSENRTRLLGYCLSEKLKVFPEHAVAYISLSLEELNRFNYKEGDTEGIVNYALGIYGIQIAAFFTEKPDCVRISFRSVGDISVNEISNKYFDGGGHRNAAGGNSYVSLEETLRHFEALMPELKNFR